MKSFYLMTQDVVIIAFRVVLLGMRNKVLQAPAKEGDVVVENHFTY